MVNDAGREGHRARPGLPGRARRRRDGSFGTDGYPANVAVTSLAALALMAGGTSPTAAPTAGRPPALDFVLSRANARRPRRAARPDHPPGFLHNPPTPARADVRPRLRHALPGEVCGMVHDKALRRGVRTGLTKAVKLILSAQNNEGGWRYNPRPSTPTSR